VLIGVQCGVLALFISLDIGVLAIDGEEKSSVYLLKTLKYLVIGLFSVFLVVYILVLYKLTSRLRRYFPKFYLKEKRKIFTSNGVIIVSIIARISTNIFSEICK
jgi:hypothetical protein